MVKVVEPPAATMAGLKEQVLSLGRPAHAEKLTCALNPFDPVTVTIVVAEEPGALTFTTEGEKAIVKSGWAVTLTVIAGELDAVKFESPRY